MSTVDKVGNRKSYVKLAQLHAAIRRKPHEKFVQLMIEKLDDINYEIPNTDFLYFHRRELIASSALHLAFDRDNFEIFNLLLKYGASCYVTNQQQKTVLHRAVEENCNKRDKMTLQHRFNEYSKHFSADEVNAFVEMQRIIEGRSIFRQDLCERDNWRLWGKVEDRYVTSILSACCEVGQIPEHLCVQSLRFDCQAACLTNNAEAYNFLVKHRADPQQPLDSRIFYGFTPLHFAAKYSSAELVRVVLASKAPLISMAAKFMTPADMLVDQNLKIVEWLHSSPKLPYNNCLFDYVENEDKLKAILKRNAEGGGLAFCGFYEACTLTDTSSIRVRCSQRGLLTFDEFLEGDFWRTNDRVSIDVVEYPLSCYTAMFYASFFNIDTAKLLISNGADVEAENRYGLTPLDILETRATIDDLHFIVSHKQSWKSIVLSDGQTKLLDLISSMNDLTAFNSFLNKIDINLPIRADSPLWPGYTTLHLVVTFSETSKRMRFLKNIFNADRSNLNVEYGKCCQDQAKSHRDKIELCLIKNADVTVRDARGWTPINLAFRQRKMEAVNFLLQYHDKIVNPTDEDNLSHLHIACVANNQSLVEKLLSNGADVNAAIKSSFEWQCDYHHCTSINVFDLSGSTPLHLSVSSGNLDLVKILLKYGANVNAKDALGMSPLHRIFVLKNLWETGNELYKVPKTVKCICRIRRRVELPGFSLAEESLHNVGNELLLSPNLRESIVEEFGLSHLHVAVFENNVVAAMKLLDLGSDINSVIKCTKELEPNHPLFVLSRYDGYTPLHMCRGRYELEPEKSLLERGADFLASRTDGMNRLFDKLKTPYSENIDLFVSSLRDNETIRTRLQNEFGWTILHVACQLIDIELTTFAFSIGVNLNLQTNENSPIYPGCTALHILMMNCHKIEETDESEAHLESILSILLANGADVTLTDVHMNTALHRSDFIPGCLRRSYTNSIYTGRLLEHVKNFKVNPVNHEGISMFHIACIRHNVEAIKKFLENGVDVNQPIEFFSDYLPGCSPLHLAVSFRSESQESEDLVHQLQTVALLLKSGVKVNVEDAYGDTPLHATAKCDPPRDIIFEMIIRSGGNADAKNVYGKTPLELLLSSSRITSQELEAFLKLGYRINVCNEITQVGYVSLLFQHSSKFTESASLRVALSCPSINEVDCFGRTVIHNVVSNTGLRNDEDHVVIGYFMERGCNINHQDKSGMTALHLAARFRNFRGVEGLLMHGADVNIVDSTGRTAFTYTLETNSLCDLIDIGGHNHHLVIEPLSRFIYHMDRRGLYVNDRNRQSLVRAFGQFSTNRSKIEEDYNNVKDTRIGNTAFTVDHFFSETKAIVSYSKISQEDRQVIEQFFTNTVEKYEFHNWTFLCKLQYRKALQRRGLVDRAKDAMNVVMRLQLPDLCFDVIEKFLSNADLESLIAATL